MDTKEGKLEDESTNKDSRPSEEIKMSNNKSKDNEKVSNMDDPLEKNKSIKSDEMESEKKQEKNSKEKEHIEECNHVKDQHNAANGDIEMKFILDNKHLHTALSIPGSRSGTPNTARKRKNRHLDEMNMAEMISLSGVESLCTISNYDAMSTRGFDDDEEGGEQEDEVDEGIGVHHVLAVLLAMMSIAIVLLLYFLVPCPMEPANWIVEMEGIVASSPLRLLDVNRDGMDDVIFGFSVEKPTNQHGDVAQLCVNLNLSAPCGEGVMAISGWRGEVLWRLDLNQVNHTTIDSLVCNQLDVNDDGQFDCLAAGNNGVLLAINTKTGQILWEADTSVTVPGWTYSQPQTLPRYLDDDGVYDLVVTHGVNTESKQDEDEVGRVVLLSGKTGQSLGDFLTMPDGHASVTPPIIFQASDDQEATPYVVFGSRPVSGSESTNPGSMWMITLDRLLCHVTGSDCAASTLSVDHHQSHLTSTEDHVVELVRGIGDGFLLPAIVADMTMDGVNDLIIVSHDALITAINGSSFKPLWSRHIDVGSVYRPYSVTAPGRFNHDEVPDLMIQLGPHEDSSNTTNKILILDGLTGGDLWHTVTQSSFDNQPAAFKASPLSLKGQEEKDSFTFWLEDLPIQEDGTTTQGNTNWCSNLISTYPTLNLVIMDRDMAMDPPSLLSFKPFKPINGTQNSVQSSDATTNQPISTTVASHMTSVVGEASSTVVVDVTPILGRTSTHPISSTLSPGRERRSTYEDNCMMIEPIITSTGVIQDLDNDGSLEAIVAVNMMSINLGSSPSIEPQRNLTIQRKNVERALNENKRIQLVQSFLSPSVENSTISGSIFDHLNLLETKLQTWLGYMGHKADGRYT